MRTPSSQLQVSRATLRVSDWLNPALQAWLLLYPAGAFSFVLDAAGSPGSPLSLAYWGAHLAGIVQFVIWRARTPGDVARLRSAPLGAAILLVTVVGIGALWSARPEMPLITAARLILLFLAQLGLAVKSVRLRKHLGRTGMAGMVLIAAGAVMYSVSGGDPFDPIRGYYLGFLNQNAGSRAAVFVLILALPWRRSPIFSGAALATAGFLLQVGSGSRQVLFAAAAAILVGAAARVRRRNQVHTRSLYWLAAGGACLWAVVNFQSLVAAISPSGEYDPSLTNRVPLWDYLWAEVAARPYLGFGVGAYWDDPITQVNLAGRLGWVPRQAHNVWLELLIGGGALLLLAFVLVVVANVFTPDPVGRTVKVGIAALLVFGLTGSILRGGAELEANYLALLTVSSCLGVSGERSSRGQGRALTGAEP